MGIGGTYNETQPQFGSVDSSFNGCSLQTRFEICAGIAAQVYFFGTHHH
jgi:hypothetical protein